MSGAWHEQEIADRLEFCADNTKPNCVVGVVDVAYGKRLDSKLVSFSQPVRLATK
ncbi:MAG: hypothetical protein L0387_27115 [Acidobacteria bacterium]|nr:hypothetical protein [Acidobacteriota bacterium]